MDVRHEGVRFAVFGPMRAWRGDIELNLGPHRQRALLATLVVAGGRPTGVSELVDVLWAADPPASAVNVVHRYVGVLRRVLEPGLAVRDVGHLLLRASGGYWLAGDVSSDLADFRRIFAQAERSETPREVAELYARALDIARAPIALGIDHAVRANPMFSAVDRERADAASRAADAALALGEADAAQLILPSLRRVASVEVFNEPLQARLMLVLAAAGLQADALATFETIRLLLDHELGLDPGTELRRAYQQLLSAPSVTLASQAEQRASTTRAQVPAQLPPSPADFAGRGAELRAAMEMLRVAEPGRPAAVVITAIEGMAGIGKTTLAVEWAHQIADQYPDGQLYVNMRGFDQGGRLLAPADAVRGFLDALGFDRDRMPIDLDELAGLYRSQLAGRRILVVLDNARDTEQVRPLLPGGSGCLVIITSRNKLGGLVATAGARPLLVDVLSTAESNELLTRRLGAARLGAEPGAVAAVVTACAGLPLALAIVAARIALNSTLTFAAVAGELTTSAAGLEAMSVGEDGSGDLRTVFSWSYRALPAESARLFRLMAAHPGPDISIPAAVSLSGTAEQLVRIGLSKLVSSNLLTEVSPERYAFHDLLRAYATELLDAGDGSERLEAEARVVDHYVHSARACFSLQVRPPIADPDPPHRGVIHEAPKDMASARRWFRGEKTVLKAVVELAIKIGAYRSACLLVLDWRPLDEHIRSADVLPQIEAAVRVSVTVGIEAAIAAELHMDAANRYTWIQDFERAEPHFLQALHTFEDLEDSSRQIYTLTNMVRWLVHQRRLDEACSYANRAVEIGRQGVDSLALTYALDAAAFAYIESGDAHKGIVFNEESVRMFRELPAETAIGSLAIALGNLGEAHLAVGAYSQAISCLQESVELAANLDDEEFQTKVLPMLGDALLKMDRAQDAVLVWKHDLTLLNELGARRVLIGRELAEREEAVRSRLEALRFELPARNAGQV
jgi:DNA-binding SARP family transcriptional activator/tetratricopeptide (TPR) repeat protein